jgi:hypothetical protein
MALKLNHNKAILYFEHVGEVREKINHFTRYYFHNKASNSSYCLLYLLILSRHLRKINIPHFAFILKRSKNRFNKKVVKQTGLSNLCIKYVFFYHYFKN